MSHRRSIWVHCILTVPGGRMPRKCWRPRWPLSLIRAGRGLRLKAVTSVFADPDDYVRVHACVRVDQRHLQYLPPQQVGVIISELKFSSQELTNAFSVNHFLLGLDSLLSAMATGHLKTQAAWLRRFENIFSSREMKVKKILWMLPFSFLLSTLFIGELSGREPTLLVPSDIQNNARFGQISAPERKCINSTGSNLLIPLITTFTWHHILAWRLTNKDRYLALGKSGHTGSQLWLRGNNLAKYIFPLIKTSYLSVSVFSLKELWLYN